MTPTGRPPGKMLHAATFEFALATKGLLKQDVAHTAGIHPSTLAGLLARRGCASPAVVERLAATLEVKPEALFPELAGWVSPLPDRTATRATLTT